MFLAGMLEDFIEELDSIPVYELELPFVLSVNKRQLPVIGQFKLYSTGTRVEKVLLSISWSKRTFLNFIEDFRNFFDIDLEHSWFESISNQDKVRLIASLKHKWLATLNEKYSGTNYADIENIIHTLAALECWKLVDIEYELVPR